MIISNSNDNKARLDKLLFVELSGVSRSKIQKMIKDGSVLVNGKRSKANYTVSSGDEIYVKDKCFGDDFSTDLTEGTFDLEVIHEGKDFFVINKPSGLMVHGGESSLDSNSVAGKVSSKVEKGVFERFRPGIVHRLDKHTSGALIIAKTKKGYDYFVEQFKGRKIKKIYLALVKGKLDYPEGIINSPIGRSVFNRKKMALLSEKEGKMAISEYKVLKEFNVDKNTIVSLLEVDIKTGRTHQIRVHLASIGHFVVGDDTYGIRSFNNKFKKLGLDRQFLHAWKLGFKDPVSGKKLNFEAKLPEDLQDVLDRL